MHEGKKLVEAEYFLARMADEQAKMDRGAFRHNLSAFLAAARAVLQYALEEARAKSGGQKWYEGHITSSAILAFFRDARNADIHDEPVKTVANHFVSIHASASFTDSVSFELRDKDGNLQRQGSSPPESPPASPIESGTTHTVQYRFDKWGGTENVLILCTMCLQALQAVVADGVARGLITG